MRAVTRAFVEALPLALAFAVIALGATIAICGCPTPEILKADPKIYPCGVNGVPCPTQHSCCDEGNTCGGEPDSMPGCPSGMCCFIQPNDYSARRDGGAGPAPVPTRQRPQ